MPNKSVIKSCFVQLAVAEEQNMCGGSRPVSGQRTTAPPWPRLVFLYYTSQCLVLESLCQLNCLTFTVIDSSGSEEEFVPRRDAKGDERLEQGLRPVQERMQERYCGEHTQR